MASIDGNLVALIRALQHAFTLYPTGNLQNKIERQRDPVMTVRHVVGAAPTTFTEFAGRGYQITVHTASEGDAANGVLFVSLGSNQPASISDRSVVRLRAGDSIYVPQGFDGFWYRSLSAYNGWRIQVVTVPGVKIEQSTGRGYAAQAASTARQTAITTAPSTSANGMPIAPESKTVTVVLRKYAATVESDIDTTVAVRVWWYMVDAAGTVGIWCNSTPDDFTGTAGGINAAQTYEVPVGATRVCVQTISAGSDYTARIFSAV